MPFVSRITAPTIGPIAFGLPALTFSAAAGSASIARFDDRLELAGVRHLRQALALDDLGRVATLGDQGGEHLARGAGRHLLGLDHPDERREGLGRDLRGARVHLPVARLAQPGDQLAR